MASRILTSMTMLLVFWKVNVMESQKNDNYRCSFLSQLANCSNNSQIRILKSQHYYYLDIRICSNHRCTESVLNGIQWIECTNICQHCKSLTAQECGSNQTRCEWTVDVFVNSLCKNITLASQTITVGPTCSQPDTLDLKTTKRRAATVTTTVIPSCSQNKYQLIHEFSQPTPLAVTMERSSSTSRSTDLESTVKSAQTINSVLVLLSLSVVLLAVVTTGWVCTCILTKKKVQSPQSSLEAAISKSEDDKEMECTNNPSYEVMRLQQNQTRSDVREDYVQASGSYEYVN